MIIVSIQDLMKPCGDGHGRNLTRSFIRKNDREMGGRGKPRRYDLAVVDDFLHRYFRELLHQEHAVKQQAEQMHRDIDTYIQIARGVQAGPGEMVGRGGRTAEVGKMGKGPAEGSAHEEANTCRRMRMSGTGQ